MTIQSEIDETLRRLGSAEPPIGLGKARKPSASAPAPAFFPRPRGSTCSRRCAVVASIALSAVALNPALRNLVLHPHSQSMRAVDTPRVVAPCGGRVWDCFGGSRAGAAGSGAAHAG